MPDPLSPAARPEAPAAAPRAPRRPVAIRGEHGVRVDDYAWLRDDERRDPEVLAHLSAENAHYEAAMARLAPLKQRLYAEIVGRLREDDASVPVRERGYWYWTRYQKGGEFPIHLRRADAPGAPEEVVLDENLLAAGHDYHEIGSFEVSDDNRLVAYTEDTVGRREYRLKIRLIGEAHDLQDCVENVEEEIAWAADSATVLYVEKHPQTLLGHRLLAHRLGEPASADRLLYEQTDDTYYTSIYRGRSGAFLYLVSSSTVATEYRYARADDPALGFKLVLERERDHEYHVDDQGDRFLILSNAGAPNFRLLEATPDTVTYPGQWRELVAHRTDTLLTGLDAFADFIVLGERANAVHRLRILPTADLPQRLLGAELVTGSTTADENPEFASRRLRYLQTSPTLPHSLFEIDLDTGETKLLKVEPVVGGFDATRYVAELVWVPARDGVRVPVTLFYARGLRRDGSAPLYQYGYGAYGLSSDASFSSVRLSLVDRGFVYAIAHVRGGQELGRAWYDAGRLANKTNSFDDFIDVTRWLISERYVDARRTFATGASAGGLLLAAVANRAPGLYRGLVVHVPFVDVLTTMQDESIPLTTTEYDEWGDPRLAADYRRISAWSPLDNVTAQPYPALLVSAGLWDSQVQYWEPAKWVAKLRAHKVDDAPLLLHMDLEVGHGGKSGRYERLEEVAGEYAFVLDLAGLGQA